MIFYIIHYGTIYLIIFLMLLAEGIAIGLYRAAREIGGSIYPIAIVTVEFAYVLWIIGIQSIRNISGG